MQRNEKCEKIDVDTIKTESERYPARILKFGDDFDSMDSCLEMYLKSGKTSTPKRGKGQRISQKNYKYHSDSDKEDYEVQFGSHISKKPPSKKRKVQKDSSKKNSLYSMVKENINKQSQR
ncbi:uncharacterized protein LOC124436008 [Xenia sp. Carnegie-2017]|uniref:uncharacterized protein LOC124436008 n=1 Tax=Xenia sp. Carnegie-2017 TaxID=2897299 RepID=UPI001F03D19C|nr:uncharacterized protein LOC124436008 [Xenia sp. Carnegie-2017]